VRRRRIAAGAVAAAGAAALVLATAGVALPPGGVADQPGTPAGSLTITTPEVPQQGDVGFCVQNIRVDTAGGPAAQPFMLKFDDHGSNGIGPFTPAADGSLCATVSTDPADYPSGAADKLPSDLCDPAKAHWLRLLTGAWAHPDGSQRSIAAGFTVTGACGDGGGGSGGGGGTGTGTTPATPGAPATTTPAATPGTAAEPPVRAASATLTTSGRSVVVKLKAASSFARGSLLLRSVSRLRVGRSAPARRTLARGSFQIAAGDTLALRLPLTADARSVLRTRASLAGALTIAPRDARPTTTTVTVRRPRGA